MAEASVSGSPAVATSPQVTFEIDDTGTDTTLDGTRSSQSQQTNESRLRRRTESIGELAITLPETTAERFIFWAVAVILACVGLWVALRQTAISEWTAKKDYWEHCQDSQYTEEACEKAKTTPLEPPPVSLNWARPKVRSLPQPNTQPMDTFPGLAVLFVGFPVITVAWLPFRRRINSALRRPLRFALAGSQQLQQQPRFLVLPEEQNTATTLPRSPHSFSTSTSIDDAHSLAARRVMDVPGVDCSLKIQAKNEVTKAIGCGAVSLADDIWSLGLIFFEMLVWVLLGHGGDEFPSKGRGSRSTTLGRSLNGLRVAMSSTQA
ncbi:hypothetical protein QBC40DRAFT_254169 [Triangularia verruculosa]|uniref:Uncharacterized protein n=1 Tax=Triangularia verruculosa TaxID=2587418 RepID=A0AAN7AWX6_9PEZI|nr:hypothetical protein QBC40DRAFT_254169 [Triangularia verruculosa]